MNEKIRQILDDMLENQTIPSKDIPDIDLYMDQVTTFIEEKLKNFKRVPSDKILTKTMINNYTKDKVLPPPVKKKYSKDHIFLLILIYHLKNCITISDIGILLSSFIDKKKQAKTNPKKFYDAFEKIQVMEREKFFEDFERIEAVVNNFNEGMSETEKNMLTAAALINQANQRKRMAEKIIDEMLSSSKEN